MPTVLPSPLRDHVVAPEMPPAVVGHLVRSYHGATVDRLAPARRDGTAPVTWLHPRTVWSARMGGDRTTVGGAVPRAEAQMPDLEHVAGGSTVEPWCRWLVDHMEGQARQVDRSFRLRLSPQPLDDLRATVGAAERVLWRVWPDAAVANRFLLRSMVHVEGPEFRSATVEAAFGAVLAGAPSVASVPAAFEMLLHEGGHHSLYLRNAFEVFVTNPDDLVSHPLRDDPRPISGTVHAAHVLTRMATGLARWCAVADAPEEAHARRDDAVAKLSATLDVLRGSARWTPAGARYVANLEARAAALRAPVPA